jgi:glycerol-3-phosphate acyltransferase PlsY
MHFKGGKGIASTLGLFWVCLACEEWWWIFTGFAFLLFIAFFIFWTEWGSLGSLLGVTGFSIVQMLVFVLRYAQSAVNAYTVCLFLIIFAINALTWCAHHQNLIRLFAGEEHHTSIKKLAKKKR